MSRRASQPGARPQDARRHGGRRHDEALLYVQRLTKIYPLERGLLRKPRLLYALSGVSFYVRDRETFGVVGESGSGKTTLGRCLLRLVEPTLGRGGQSERTPLRS